MNVPEETEVDAVAAVRKGDSERYRDLVERYERKVFAVAWSRLGDSDLAEEATQETFIKGYHKLALLNDESRFGSWILAIARNVSINLGLRRRHELTKRERWAVLQEQEHPHATADEPVSGQTLREALAQLPAHHRECLVLFYLEGKSISEAASLLAVSETAFKTRLHRARAALRQRLEAHLEDSLEQLRPSKPLAPAIMVLLSGQSVDAVAAGGGVGMLAKWGALSLKLVPFQFIMAGMLALGVIPAYLLGLVERRNFRDPEGFRARYYQAALRRGLVFTLMVMVLVWLFTSGLIAVWGKEGYSGVVGLVLLLGLVPLGRCLSINRNRFVIGQLAALLTLAVGMLAVAWLGLPQPLFNLFFAAFFGWIAWSFRDLPLRMDYSLFLRVHQGFTSHSAAEGTESARTKAASLQSNRAALFHFARFLGERWLVADFRVRPSDLRLRLAPVEATLSHLIPWFWRNCSTLVLNRNGQVIAHLGPADERGLGKLGSAPADREELERAVAQAVRLAWAAFQAGDLRQAEAHLGQRPAHSIFHRRPHDAAFWRRAFLSVVAVVMAVTAIVQFVQQRFHPRQYRHLQPVNVTAEDVHRTLSRLERSRTEEPQAWQVVDTWAVMVMAWPPKRLFTDDAWERAAARAVSWPDRTGSGLETDTDVWLQRSVSGDQWQRAFASGFLTRQDLEKRGLTSQSLRAHLLSLSPAERDRLLQLETHHTVLNGERVQVLATEPLLWRLRFLHAFGCLDLVNSGSMVREIVNRQVLPGRAVTGPWSISETKRLRGLFRTYGWDPLRDTYFALSCLSLLDSLDEIDRAACAKGILRFHIRQGLFGTAQQIPSVRFTGDAQSTFFAYESLRMLNALDQVNDLDSWQFRPAVRSIPIPDRIVAGYELEAWLYQTRLQRFLDARRQNPAEEAPSLLADPPEQPLPTARSPRQ